MTPTLFGRLDKPASAVLFCGLGGSCEGIRRATGASPLVAVNHNPHALALHKLNHPTTLHIPQDVFDVDVFRASRGRRIDLLWLSPDCTHHSRAKGGKPRDAGLRSTADVVFEWTRAGSVRPRVIMLENVCEFEGWGPVDEAGQPIRDRKGEDFRAWVSRLREDGYTVEWRSLVAADYGAPTSRKRLYLIARRDGLPIRWPEPTHGPGRAQPWRTAVECIDWSIPCPSIFLSPEEARAAHVHRPLADATMRRIAAGLVRFVLESPRPYLIQTGYGERPGQTPRILDIDAPLGTVVAGGCKHGLIVPHITRFYGTGSGSDISQPLPTVTCGAHLGLVTAWLAKHNGDSVGTSLESPMDTVTCREHFTLCEARLSVTVRDGTRQVYAFLTSYYGQGLGQALSDPLRTVTTVDRFGLVTVDIGGEAMVVYDIGMRMLQPRELARTMGFPDSYRLEGPRGEQIARIGGAVCPPVAEAVGRANLWQDCRVSINARRTR